MYLVFVTQANVMLTKQKVKKDDGDDFVYPNTVAKQYCISLGSGFDDLIALTRPWED